MPNQQDQNFDLSTLTREEREILIRKSDADDTWDFFTSSPTWKAKLERLAYPLQRDHQGGFSCRLPIKAVTFRRASSLNRKLSDEQKAKQIEQLNASRKLRGKLGDI